MSIPAYDVTFTAPDPACGHETSWRQSSWWDAVAGKYRGELVVEACTCQDPPPEPLYARLRARTRPAGVAGRPDDSRGSQSRERRSDERQSAA